MQTFGMTEFLARSTDRPFEETTLSKVLRDLPLLGASGPWLAGGAIRRTLCGQEPESDYDFFFRDADQLTEFKDGLSARGFTEVRTTDHHIEMRGSVEARAGITVQMIRFAYYRTAADVIGSFDFTICQLAYDGATLTCGDFALWDLGRKRLAINKISFPLSTMRRVLKYARTGFSACPGALTAILTATANDPKLLDQLHIQYVD